MFFHFFFKQRLIGPKIFSMDVELMKNKLLLLFLLDRNEIIVMKKIVISNQFKNDLTI